MKKTKIICTIGPKSESKEILSTLLDVGMNAIRLNFSHGVHEEHKMRIQNLRSILNHTNKFVSILLDMQGPEIRTTKLQNGRDVTLYSGQNFSFILDKNIIGNNQYVGVTYSKLIDILKVGDEILVDDGMLKMSVIQFSSNSVICKVLNTGNLGENKSINLPGKLLNLPILSEKDKKDLTFGILQKIDFVAISFVRKSSDVKKIRNFLNENGGKNIQIISKIENQEGLNNFDEILRISDGIMIARGDLGVEIPMEEVVFAQKMMIKKCNQEKKIVITATQMLNSMIENPRPTRAEVSDIANAILDGTDAIMLSGESAKGKYPIEAVSVMNSICNRTDSTMQSSISSSKKEKTKLSVTEAICKSAVEISEKINASLIIVATKWGHSAKSVRKYFPKVHILALTTNSVTIRILSLTRGVICKKIKNINSLNDFCCIGKKIALEYKLVKKGDIVVVISGALYETTNSTFVCRL